MLVNVVKRSYTQLVMKITYKKLSCSCVANANLGGHTLPSCQKNGGIHWAGFGSGEEGSTRLLVHDMATA